MDTKLNSRKLGIIVILIMSLFCFLASISTVYAAGATSDKIDVRFVVDVSHNMKTQDPTKQRVRAIQKVIKSLPDNSRSGIWTYGKYVNMLVPLGVTTPKWKKDSLYKLESISGYGNYRNMGDAIEKAAHGWKNKSNYKKYIVVVTNGDLRVSESANVNAEAQLKLLTKTLPKLQQADIALHTVSLSDDADNRLLKILATETKGKWYSVAKIDSIASILNHVYTQIAAKHNIEPAITSSDTSFAKLKSPDIKKSSVLLAHNDKSKNSEQYKTQKVKAGKTEYKGLHEEFHKKPKSTTVNFIDDEIERNKKENFYKNRKEMDFNWPTVHSG